ncbi:hypothetical protein ACFYMX_11230 [Streptomyces griseofuscus]|uniref:Uncharacterized protein n=1 Tax=Streptomyces griseofuscus TaxID=146922 RepID=A0A7H1PX64_9ACTN|nr:MULTISPECIES: hypothetical protein [Streptomyces]BBC93283.1 hypothetical protein SRO_2107 [Streptomyces rochei]MBA9048487.1 hypothetical protein [Streptomyces murinus]MBJ7003783.1 hypothetical protein [Streptomyces sp. CRPSP2-6A1]MYQ95217.1 hypothetical protein [Streptomyces sp. SID4946]MYR88061.1 hypothetical protein [Streptomyces sp. SID685]
MSRRREPVPFAFLAEGDTFRSNVTPPPRRRASFGEMAGRWLLGLTVVAGLVGALIIGMPSLSTPADPPAPQSRASEGH